MIFIPKSYFLSNLGQAMEEPEEPLFIKALKEGILKCDLSLAELAKACGTTHSQLSRFVRGERTLSLPTAANLYEFLGFKLIPPKRPRKKRIESKGE